MSNLILEDLKGLDDDGVKNHIAVNYAGNKSGFDYGCINAADEKKVAEYLSDYSIVIAYESVGSWGCDSSSYFLIQHNDTGDYQEFSGSHCSCYGFEGQFSPEDVTLEYLKSDKFHFYCGGYDDNETANQKAVKDFLAAL